MAYKNIVFVKLERRLLNDHRWYMLSEPDQLLYIKLILLAAETYNRIPKNDISKPQTDFSKGQNDFSKQRFDSALKLALRTNLTNEEIEAGIARIMANFPKLKSNKYFYYFEEFEHKTNWVAPQQLPSNSPANAQQHVDIDIDLDIDIDKEEAKSGLRKANDLRKLIAVYTTKYKAKFNQLNPSIKVQDKMALLRMKKKYGEAQVLNWFDPYFANTKKDKWRVKKCFSLSAMEGAVEEYVFEKHNKGVVDSGKSYSGGR